MDDLVAFLNARLDEDEAAAEAIDQEPQRPVIGDTEPRPVRWYSMRAWFAPDDGWPAPYEDKKRTALADLFDPARVLREVAAKRVIIKRHVPVVAGYGPLENQQCCGAESSDEDMWYANPWPCATICAIAAVYSEHPDYRQEWASLGEAVNAP